MTVVFGVIVILYDRPFYDSSLRENDYDLCDLNVLNDQCSNGRVENVPFCHDDDFHHLFLVMFVFICHWHTSYLLSETNI